MTIKIGLTGGIGSGKSMISHLFEIMGVKVYNADNEAKRIMNYNASLRNELIALLGEDIYLNNELNKPLLASYIFTSESHKHKVNDIVHPKVRSDFKEWIEQYDTHALVGLESAILIEAAFAKEVDVVVMVYAPKELRIQRVMKRDGTSRKQADDRINSQLCDEEKKDHADYVIINDDNTPLIPQVLRLITSLSKNNNYLCRSKNI